MLGLIELSRQNPIDLHGEPEMLTLDKSGANTAAIAGIQADSGLTLELRRSKYLNNIVEQAIGGPSSASCGR